MAELTTDSVLGLRLLVLPSVSADLRVDSVTVTFLTTSERMTVSSRKSNPTQEKDPVYDKVKLKPPPSARVGKKTSYSCSELHPATVYCLSTFLRVIASGAHFNHANDKGALQFAREISNSGYPDPQVGSDNPWFSVMFSFCIPSMHYCRNALTI